MYVIDDDTRRFGRLLHYVGLLVALVCATVGYTMLHAPTARAVSETSLKIEELLLSVQNAPLIRQHHRQTADTLRDVMARIDDVQRSVPRDADAGEFLREISRIANEQRLAIKDFQPERPVNKQGYAEMQVTLNGTGSFASICAFIDQLNRLSRLSKVDALTLSAVDGAAEYPMSATLVIYFGLHGSEANATGEARRG